MRISEGVQQEIYRAVEVCVNAGISPEDFRQEAAECWVEKCRQDAERARKVLGK